MLILAREAGLGIERADVDVTPLTDIGPADTDVDSFMDSLKDQDAAWKKRMSENRQMNRRLQYVGVMENQRLRVGLQDIGPDSPLFALTGTDNLVAFTTNRYSPNPLVIRGPGAGPTVTAAGVLADILKVAEFIT
jgi:aspartokinase/homoserine dehydrogenase 1